VRAVVWWGRGIRQLAGPEYFKVREVRAGAGGAAPREDEREQDQEAHDDASELRQHHLHTPTHKTRVETRPPSLALCQSPPCPVRRALLALPAALADMRQQLSPTAILTRMPQRKTFPPQRPSPPPSPPRRQAKALCPTMTPRTLATTMTPPMPASTSTRPASPAASHCADCPSDTSSRK
jgi:hypothetical protein